MKISVTAVLTTALLLTGAAGAQEPEKKLACGKEPAGHACEMREATMAAPPLLTVDAAPNGGVAVKAWKRNEVLVRSKVVAWGEAKLADVKVAAGGSRVAAEGPRAMPGRSSGWSVSFEVFVPEKIGLDLKSVNGGISVAGVTGDLRLKTTNGGINLADVGGKVNGHTTNGGISLSLAGAGWTGDSCELETTNGGIHIEAPERYGARIVATTTNGGLKSDFPNTKVERGRWTGGTLEVTPGGGAGPTVKATTTNGGITVRPRGTAQL